MSNGFYIFGVVLGLLLLEAVPAFAGDGVREINQACAAVGCWAGDDSGLPVQIVDSASYRLTSGLLLVDENTTGIQVLADDVSIDLNGFTIKGPVMVIVSGVAPECSATGTGIGIDAVGAGGERTEVRGGSVIGTGGTGIRLGYGSRVERVAVQWSCGDGIETGSASFVVDSRSTLNRDFAIKVGNDAHINGATASESTSGIYAGGSATIFNSASNSNFMNGMVVSTGTVVTSSTASYNDQNGIQTGGSILVLNSFLRENGSWGVLSGEADTGFGGNVFSGNTTGGISQGVATHCNAFNGSYACPP